MQCMQQNTQVQQTRTTRVFCDEFGDKIGVKCSDELHLVTNLVKFGTSLIHEFGEKFITNFLD